MAKIEVLFQGLVDGDDHEAALNQLLAKQNIDCFLLSIAFARSSGINQIKTELAKVADKSKIFVGIRNGVTSIQSITSLLDLGILPYVVDTASNKKIFHPKIYIANGENKAFVVLGSANLTFSGLNQNIEASSFIELNFSHDKDKVFHEKLINTLENLPANFPDHVFQIVSVRQAVKLLHEGRLEDERVTRLPTSNVRYNGRDRDDLSPMPTFEKRNTPTKKAIKKRPLPQARNTGILVWESKPLTERSLNIPQGANTNITGDMNLGRGALEGIDFQHYFRGSVFVSLNWRTDPNSRSAYLERAIINAEIIIKNISYGEFQLEVVHDPRTDTRSYAQKNTMTKIKWGEARSHIAKRDLLNRTVRIFKKSNRDFSIIID